jgi:GH15 family glucan-1,4-alpha-glucosidase
VDLFRRSIDIIRENQSPSGAYIASPNFPTYGYCWFRDGSYIAYSMDIVGNHASSRAFFHWTDTVISRYSHKVQALKEELAVGNALNTANTLNTRYTLAGEEMDDNWENFQLDGYGTWLWALNEHLQRSPDPTFSAKIKPSVETILSYLSLLWDQPNYDCWEEAAEYIHTHTLAAIYAGLVAGAQIVGGERAEQARMLAVDVRSYIHTNCICDGRLVKSIHPSGCMADAQRGVDASLIGASIPYDVYAPQDDIFLQTIARIEDDLHQHNGGVYRYLQDTYYGGGEWVLLAAWLGWYYAKAGKRDQALELRTWIEKQADQNGCLPEQISENVLSEAFIAQWIERWGPIANPLLWSHAMYIILTSALEIDHAS